MFQRILVANRGEIALRVIRACKELGVEVVAVYSQADRTAPYLALADRAICIGKGASARTATSTSARLIAAAEVADCPGDPPRLRIPEPRTPQFAEVCGDCNIDLHRPAPRGDPPDGFEDRGQGRGRRSRMSLASRALTARSADDDRGHAHRWPDRSAIPSSSRRRPVAEARGCGSAATRRQLAYVAPVRPERGRGRFQELLAFISKSSSIDPVTSRSRSSPTAHGHVVHCWDRDCSLQRRHQKLVEEGPSSLPLKVRRKLGDAAVRLAKACGYVNAGTCEFLVDSDDNFYFIEVNARIQVEHPVSEMITGIDLVKQQIRIAAGEPLGFTQDQIPSNGHAIEVRINAEDPAADFRPSPGLITGLRIPGGPGVRWDSHVQVGYGIPPHYDSLVGKLIAHGPDRPSAIATLRRALDELVVDGIQTTLPLLRTIVRHPDFIENRVDTTWVERTLMPAKLSPTS